LQADSVRIRDEVRDKTTELARVQQDLAEAREAATRAVADAEAEFHRRLAEAVERPATLLADVTLLRAFLPTSIDSSWESGSGPLHRLPNWPRSAPAVSDRIALQRALTGAFNARGVTPASALRLHAAIMAGLLPVVIGNGGLAALAAYAHAVC